MYPFGNKDRKQTPPNKQQQAAEYLLLSSEPAMHEYLPGWHLTFRYQNRYLAKRRVMRNIRRQLHRPRL